MHWPRIKKDSGTVERRKTSRPPMPLFLSCVGDIIPCRIELCFMALLVLCSITRSSWWSNSSGYSEWKIAFSNSNIEDNLTRPGKNFQSESILSVIRDDPLLDNRTRWIHEGTMRSWRHGVKVSGHHDGYWVGFADTRVLLVWNGYRQVLTTPRRYDLMIDVNQGVHLGESERYAILHKKVKQGSDTTRKSFWPTILEKQ
jgi:hypothetical protein